MARIARLLIANFAVAACSSAPDEAVVAPSSPSVVRPAELGPGSFTRAWSVDFGGRDRTALAIAPRGEVVALTDKTLRVLSGKDGSILRSAIACSSARSIAFTSERELAVVCHDEIVVFAWPGLARRELALKDTGVAGLGPARIATTERLGVQRVRVRSLPDLRVVDWFDALGAVEDLSFSPDGGLLAVSIQGGIYLRNVRDRSGSLAYTSSSRSGGALSFSADGSRLFAYVGAGAVEIDARSGNALRSFEMTLVRAAAHLGSDLLVTTGHDGLALLHGASGKPTLVATGKPLETDVAAAPDGRFFCASGDAGQVECFAAPSRGATAPRVAIVPLPADAPPDEPPPVVVKKVPETTTPPGHAILWRREEFTWHVLLSPDGESLLVPQGSELTVRSAKDGSLVKTGSICTGSDRAIGFGRKDLLVVACEDRLQVLRWPSLAEKASFDLPADLNVAAIGGGRIAVDVEDTARIRVYSLDGFKLIDELEPSNEVARMALSPDGSLLAFVPEKTEGVFIRNIAGKSTRTLLSKGAGYALTFSRDGKKLFGMFAEPGAVELDVATGGQERVWPVRSMDSAVYTDAGEIVVAGGEGLAILAGKGGDKPVWTRWLDHNAVARGDGSVLCATSHEEIVCLSRTQ